MYGIRRQIPPRYHHRAIKKREIRRSLPYHQHCHRFNICAYPARTPCLSRGPVSLSPVSPPSSPGPTPGVRVFPGISAPINSNSRRLDPELNSCRRTLRVSEARRIPPFRTYLIRRRSDRMRSATRGARFHIIPGDRNPRLITIPALWRWEGWGCPGRPPFSQTCDPTEPDRLR